MTNAELIQKIRNEIERKRQAIRVLNEHTEPEQMSKTCAIFQYSDSILSELLSFLSTLESEKPMNLEEEIKSWIPPIKVKVDEDVRGIMKHIREWGELIARHFAEWGYLRAAEKYNEIEYNRQREEESGSSEIPNDLEEAADEYAEKHGFRVPYDGSDNFYDDIDVKASKEGFIAGAEWAMNRFEPATFGNTLGDTELFKKK